MFSPQALQSLNSTTFAQRVTAKEARAWAKAKDQPWAIAQVADLLKAGEPMYLVDGDIISERQMDESYHSCGVCGALVSSKPLTWGVMQYQESDGEIVCNPCFAKRMADGVKVVFGVDAHWPRMGDAGMTMDVFRHALDERVVEDALTAAGYERVYETGVEGTGYGVTSETALDECLTQMAMYGNALFVLTRILGPFAADITLWRKGGV